MGQSCLQCVGETIGRAHSLLPEFLQQAPFAQRFKAKRKGYSSDDEDLYDRDLLLDDEDDEEEPMPIFSKSQKIERNAYEEVVVPITQWSSSNTSQNTMAGLYTSSEDEYEIGHGETEPIQNRVENVMNEIDASLEQVEETGLLATDQGHNPFDYEFNE